MAAIWRCLRLQDHMVHLHWRHAVASGGWVGHFYHYPGASKYYFSRASSYESVRSVCLELQPTTGYHTVEDNWPELSSYLLKPTPSWIGPVAFCATCTNTRQINPVSGLVQRPQMMQLSQNDALSKLTSSTDTCHNCILVGPFRQTQGPCDHSLQAREKKCNTSSEGHRVLYGTSHLLLFPGSPSNLIHSWIPKTPLAMQFMCWSW